jgi:hypothetical protein
MKVASIRQLPDWVMEQKDTSVPRIFPGAGIRPIQLRDTARFRETNSERHRFSIYESVPVQRHRSGVLRTRGHLPGNEHHQQCRQSGGRQQRHQAIVLSHRTLPLDSIHRHGPIGFSIAKLYRFNRPRNRPGQGRIGVGYDSGAMDFLVRIWASV